MSSQFRNGENGGVCDGHVAADGPERRGGVGAGAPHILVGTPGRLNALVRNGLLKCNTVRTFILDKCDNMLESVG